MSVLAKFLKRFKRLIDGPGGDNPPTGAAAFGRRQRPQQSDPATLFGSGGGYSAHTSSERLDGYRQALEEHFCISVTDSDGRLREVNRRFCDVTGYEPEELIGQHYELLNSGRHSDEFINEMWSTVCAGRTWRGEFCDRCKDGNEIWLESIVIPRFDASGSIDHFVTISTDITPIRKQADTLNAMIENFPGGIALIDSDARLVARNKLYASLLDIPDSLFATPRLPLETLVRFRAKRGDYGPGQIDDIVVNRLKVLLSSEPNVDERHETTGRVLEIRCVPIPGGGYLNTYIDVSKRRRAEMAFRQAHATLEAFIKHAPAAVAMFDKDMRYVAHTERWLQDYNLPPESLVGRSHYDVFPEIPEHWKAKHQRILAGATERSPEEVFRRADGSENIIRWEVRPWYLQDATIGGMVMLTEDISERKALEAQLRRTATIDSLTELPNRLQFHENLDAALERASRSGEKLAVGLVDLDRFKETNDILGHSAGDELLKEVGARLHKALAPFGTIARLGGDEFAMLIPRPDEKSRLNRAVEATFAAMSTPVVLNGVRHRCTISLGVTTYPDDAETASELLKNADLALYSAKERGRDRFELYAQHMRTAIERTYKLHQDIRTAVVSNAFRLLYQPVVSMNRDKPVSFEALLRWNHPQRGWLSPAEFSEVFNDPKTASEIGRWVLDSVVQQIAKWEKAGLPFGRVAFNVTSADFALGGFADLVRDTLHTYGVAPERLCVEVTEHVFLGRGAIGVAEALQSLHELGVEIALDDFGTGFGTLTHINRFPINRLKVDRSFVIDMETNPDNMAIVRAVTQLSQSIGLDVTIEGVETTSQLALLRAMGCDSMQGYLFSKPMEASRVPRFVRRQEHVALSA